MAVVGNLLFISCKGLGCNFVLQQSLLPTDLELLHPNGRLPASLERASSLAGRFSEAVERNGQHFCHMLGAAASADAGCSGTGYKDIPPESHHSKQGWQNEYDEQLIGGSHQADTKESIIEEQDTQSSATALNFEAELVQMEPEPYPDRVEVVESTFLGTKQSSAQTKGERPRDQDSHLQLADTGRTLIRAAKGQREEVISAYQMLEPAESAERALPVGIANQGRATNGHQRHILTQILDRGVIVDGPGSDPIHSWKEASTYGLLAIALTLLTCGVALGAAGYYFYRRHREMIIYADTDAFYQACAGALGEQVRNISRQLLPQPFMDRQIRAFKYKAHLPIACAVTVSFAAVSFAYLFSAYFLT
jgi:hypothetical protein